MRIATSLIVPVGVLLLLSACDSRNEGGETTTSQVTEEAVADGDASRTEAAASANDSATSEPSASSAAAAASAVAADGATRQQAALPGTDVEVIVLTSVEEAMDWLQDEDWWGEENHETQLEVPRAIMTGISPRWQTSSQELTVNQKKEVFYRFLLPLVVHANGMVLERRERLLDARERLAGGEALTPDELDEIRSALVTLRVSNEETAASLGADSDELVGLVDELVVRLDVIPAGLALGQAAYESGYGTSRFAAAGNALFGQWAFGGEGLVPEQQREHLGDYRIAAFEWPFDSVRAYFLNLMSNPAYADFRRLRADLRAAGQPLSSLTLADGLTRYSERGQEYVDTLKGIIRVNGLEIADNAVFRDEPMRFLTGAEDAAAADALRAEIERMRGSGELAEIIERMRLE
jgi:Bax protein